MPAIAFRKEVKCFDVQELVCEGISEGNPFTERSIHASFSCDGQTTEVDGFYDGDGRYIVRYMPSAQGVCSFTISGNFSDHTYDGIFTITEPPASNHGPVRVSHKFHFAYTDGTPYFPIGTTCYVWELQDDDLIEQTLFTLSQNAFNKVRFCIFPKHYDYNFKEPRSYPYIGTPMDGSVLTKQNFNEYDGHCAGNDWDFTRFNPEYFRHIETCIKRLADLGIEADLIVMHPYDRWGFSCMTWEQDELYWRYVIARFAAFHNVWWSLANEYDLMKDKEEADWEHYADLLVRYDPYQHLRSIHNCHAHYDHTRSWITHCSIQRNEPYLSAERTNEWRETYGKPVVLDEICYEGNLQYGWGNISAQELVRRFWEATCRGGYAGHGETYLSDDSLLWWSHGGILHGETGPRLRFLQTVLSSVSSPGLRYRDTVWDETCATIDDGTSDETAQSMYLFYYGISRPSFRDFYIDDDTPYQVDVLDTWNMTITDGGIQKRHFRVDLPGHEYSAVRLTQKKEDSI